MSNTIRSLHVNEIVESVSETHPFTEEKLYAVNTSDVENGKMLFPPLLSTDELKGQFKKTIQNGDILFSEIRPANRHFAVVNVENPEKYVASTKLMVLRKYNNAVDSDYFYYWLTNASFLEVLQRRAENRICSFPQITFELLSEYTVPVPNIEIQKNIARFLSTVDAKLDNNNDICANLEAMAKLLYDYWFVQFDFPDENGKPYRSSGGKMVWNEELKREIPEGWEVHKIGDIISTERGISYSTPNIATGEGVPMLNLATFMPGGGDYKADGLKHYLGDYPNSKTLKPYDLIMCNTQQTAIKFETDIIGRAMLTPDVFDGDVVFSHHVNVIRTDDESLKYYLLFLFNSNYFHKYISGFTNGTNILGLSFNGVEDYLLEIPSHDILTKFGAIVLETEKKKSAIFKENRQLAELRDFLLPMLMNGQVKVGGVAE